jgi:hypothetical protein
VNPSASSPLGQNRDLVPPQISVQKVECRQLGFASPKRVILRIGSKFDVGKKFRSVSRFSETAVTVRFASPRSLPFYAQEAIDRRLPDYISVWADKVDHGKTQSFQNKFWFVNLKAQGKDDWLGLAISVDAKRVLMPTTFTLWLCHSFNVNR